MDDEKLLFEKWWGEPPIELNVLKPKSNEEALSMWVWQAWRARARLVPNAELRGAELTDIEG